MLNISHVRCKKGLETYNDIIKIFILLLCTSIGQDLQLLD